MCKWISTFINTPHSVLKHALILVMNVENFKKIVPCQVAGVNCERVRYYPCFVRVLIFMKFTFIANLNVFVYFLKTPIFLHLCFHLWFSDDFRGKKLIDTANMLNIRGDVWPLVLRIWFSNSHIVETWNFVKFYTVFMKFFLKKICILEMTHDIEYCTSSYEQFC